MASEKETKQALEALAEEEEEEELPANYEAVFEPDEVQPTSVESEI